MTPTERMLEIKDEVKDLIEEALLLVKHNNSGSYERAQRTWFAHIESALSNDHHWMGRDLCTLEESALELETL